MHGARAEGFERQAQGAQTRARIVNAAIEFFARHGCRGAGIAALAKRVNMTGAGCGSTTSAWLADTPDQRD